MTTNAELEMKLKEMEGKLKELEAKPVAPVKKGEEKIVRADRPESGGGYLVETPLKEFSGVRMGITFKNGIAVIPVEAEDADAKAHYFEHDYPYTVTTVTADELNAWYRKQQMPSKDHKSMLEKLSGPQQIQ